MKTVKEVYQSINLMPQVGDLIGDRIYWEELHPITWVEGWYYDVAHNSLGELVYNADKKELKEGWAIIRNGKQIYPALPKSEEVEQIKQDLAVFLDRSSWGGWHPDTIVHNICRLIDAKMKEALK